MMIDKMREMKVEYNPVRLSSWEIQLLNNILYMDSTTIQFVLKVSSLG